MDISYMMAYVLAGLASGFINTVASSGSAITLPLLMMLGVAPTVANGTNRIPLLIGSLSSCWSLGKKGLIDWSNGARIAPAILMGSLTGAYISTLMSPKDMTWAIFAAVIMALVILLLRPSRLLETPPTGHPFVSPKHLVVFFLAGVWAGFIVLDSATYILLTLVLLVGYDLIRANALKNAMLFVISVPSIAIFGLRGEIDWAIGVVLSIGSFLGSMLGSHFASKPSAKVWIFRLLIAVILLEIAHMAWQFGHLDSLILSILS